MELLSARDGLHKSNRQRRRVVAELARCRFENPSASLSHATSVRRSALVSRVSAGNTEQARQAVDLQSLRLEECLYHWCRISRHLQEAWRSADESGIGPPLARPCRRLRFTTRPPAIQEQSSMRPRSEAKNSRWCSALWGTNVLLMGHLMPRPPSGQIRRWSRINLACPLRVGSGRGRRSFLPTFASS